VLQLDPYDADAIAALKLKPYLGTFMTPARIEQAKRQMREMAKAATRWRPEVARWATAAEQGDAAMPAAVRKKIAQISDLPELLGLERTLWQQVGAKRRQRAYGAMLLALMPVLGDNPRPAAAAALARYAVFADRDDVRAAAIAGLNRHPLEQYATLLLGGLQSPLEGQAWVDGRSMYCSVYQEGALADLAASLAYSYEVAVLPTTVQYRFDDGTTGDLAAVFRRVSNGSLGRAEAAAAVRQQRMATMDTAMDMAAAEVLEQQATCEMNRLANDFRTAVERCNCAIQRRNAAITTVLHQVTGIDGGEDPMHWWRWWWQDYNEMYTITERGDGDPYGRPEKPLFETSAADHGHFTFGGNHYTVACSCFAPGTKVWTLAGRRPIENIKVGDRVLAQDVESGELAYKPVLAVTIRPSGRWMKVGLAAESVTATPSHPFWVAGRGWRMTKQIAAGSRLHALSGGAPVQGVEVLDAEEDPGFAYNLIVADYDDYFVGDRGVLVHDNTPRNPTAAILPGLTN
jgi:hypothetical protein